jgi:hypothetical protein
MLLCLWCCAAVNLGPAHPAFNSSRSQSIECIARLTVVILLCWWCRAAVDIRPFHCAGHRLPVGAAMGVGHVAAVAGLAESALHVSRTPCCRLSCHGFRLNMQDSALMQHCAGKSSSCRKPACSSGAGLLWFRQHGMHGKRSVVLTCP